MNKEHFTDNINVEKMAALIDKTIKFEKNNKKDRFKNMNIIYKIVPAVAAVALIFGAVNLPVFKNLNNPDKLDANAYISTTEINPGNFTTSITSNNPINTSDNVPANNTGRIEQLTVNINPKNSSKWQGFTGSSYTINTKNAHINTFVITGVTINSGAYKARGIEIYFTNETVLKTHDTVKVDEDKIIIAGDTFIDGNGNIIQDGKGKFTITDKNGVETAVNGGNQLRYTDNDADDDANVRYNKDGVKGIVDFLPYMSQKAIDSIATAEYEKAGKLNKIDTILLATMSTDLLGELALKEYDATGLKNISDTVLAFMSEEAVDKLAKNEYEKNGLNGFANLNSLLWAVSDTLLDELVLKEYEKNGMKHLSGNILAFISEDVIDELASKQVEEKGSISSSMLPFVSEDIINELARKQYEASGSISSSILPFVSDDIIDEIASKQVETKGNISSTMLPFVSEDVIDELARKNYEKNGMKNLSPDILVFMSEKAVDEIARKEYEKTGLKNMSSFVWIMSDKLIEEFEIDLSYGSPRSVGINQGWYTYYPGNKNSKVAVYEFKSAEMIVTLPTTNNNTSISNQYSMNSNESDYIEFHGTCIIEFKNGVKIEAPRDTEVRNRKGVYTITIGSSHATVINPNGTTSTLSKGTVLDGKGNIAK